VREVVRDAVLEADAVLAKSPDDVAAIERRAIAQRLRGEVTEVVQSILRAQGARQAAHERGPAYLLVAAYRAAEFHGCLRALPEAHAAPELTEIMRVFWLPLAPIPDLDAHLKKQFEQSKNDRTSSSWLDRWWSSGPRGRTSSGRASSCCCGGATPASSPGASSGT